MSDFEENIHAMRRSRSPATAQGKSDSRTPRIVVDTRNGRERVVLISADEFKRLKRRDREVLGPGDFTEADLEAVSRAEVPAEFAHLDAELNG
jgi:PHD/YefM family antitoxin component YafN of YafNO toxin-antitoxin module